MVSHPLSLFNFDFSSVIHHNEILQVTILFSHGISSHFDFSGYLGQIFLVKVIYDDTLDLLFAVDR
jgi:hypothetical protein